jgi:catechol 2,3-dioxygenase-like lactoylglutathione lyase family enzyme
VTSRMIAVALDCHDLDRMISFWCGVFGSTVLDRWRDARSKEYVEIGMAEDSVLLLQPTEQDKHVKNRMHLDLAPVGSSQREEVARLAELGATVIRCAVGDGALAVAVEDTRRSRLEVDVHEGVERFAAPTERLHDRHPPCRDRGHERNDHRKGFPQPAWSPPRPPPPD